MLCGECDERAQAVVRGDLVIRAQTDIIRESAAVVRIREESYARRALKRLRATQPFNYLATAAARALFRATGAKSELVIKHLHKVGNVRLTLPNGRVLRLWSQADDWVSNQIFWRGWVGYEPETVPLFFRLATRASATIDVGAYVGFYTLLAALANPDGRAFAFEPMPDVFERLQRNVALNNLANAQCIRSAAGDDDTTADLFHVPANMPCSSSLSYEFMKSAGELQVCSVRVTRLDSFVREHKISQVDLVKVDTESTEPQVLRGMQETLRRDRPFVICEVLGRGSETALQEILRPLGYRYYLLTADGPVERDRLEGHPEWLNYLFTTLNSDEVARL